MTTKFVLYENAKVEVKKMARILKTVLVNKGNIDWLPDGHSVKKKGLSWAKFSEMLAKHY